MSDEDKARQRIEAHQRRLQEQRDQSKPSINEKMAQEAAPWVHAYDFWCDDCEEDFTSEATKHEHRLYGEPMVTYRAFHECGNECIRYITHRDTDPYYYLSDKIHSQRQEYYADLLQAEDYGFKTLYGEPFEEYIERKKKQEQRRHEERAAQGFKGTL